MSAMGLRQQYLTRALFDGFVWQGISQHGNISCLNLSFADFAYGGIPQRVQVDADTGLVLSSFWGTPWEPGIIVVVTPLAP